MSSSRTTRKSYRDNRSTRYFGDDKPTTTEHLAKNHVANADRPMHKLRELLCEPGERSDGRVCTTCEAKCRFGTEYITRKEQQP